MNSILIAEGERNVAFALKVLMQREGYAAKVAHDGTAVMAALRLEPVDLLVLDLALDGCSGYEVCRRVREDPELAPIKIIAISARTGATCEKGLALGADACLVKPFSSAQLGAIAGHLLARPSKELSKERSKSHA